MKAYIIALTSVPKSMELAHRASRTAKGVGIDARLFEAVDQNEGRISFEMLNFKVSKRFNSDKILHRKQNFRDGMTGPECGAFMSHYRLWEKCVELGEPIIIVEHDAIFVNPLMPNFDFKDICVLTHRTASWMRQRAPLWDGTPGVKPYHSFRFISAVAYAIKPHAAQILIDGTKTHAVSEVDNYINVDPEEDDCKAFDFAIERHDPCVAIHPPVNEFSTINHEILKTRDPWKP